MYLLFSIANNYNQPSNNLECIWEERPTIERIAKFIGHSFPSNSDETTLCLVNLWNGKRVNLGDYEYRIEKGEFDHGAYIPND